MYTRITYIKKKKFIHKVYITINRMTGHDVTYGMLNEYILEWQNTSFYFSDINMWKQNYITCFNSKTVLK